MNQKNENPVDLKAKTESKTTSAQAQTALANPVGQENSSRSARNSTGELSPELLELVTELRDTVKSINPRKHTIKTLRRSLANVSDILTDIEKLYYKS